MNEAQKQDLSTLNKHQVGLINQIDSLIGALEESKRDVAKMSQFEGGLPACTPKQFRAKVQSNVSSFQSAIKDTVSRYNESRNGGSVR
jgi:hypothetical protein